MTTPTPRHEEYNADSLAAYALAIQEGKDTLAPDEQAHMCAAFSACLRDLAAAQEARKAAEALAESYRKDAERWRACLDSVGVAVSIFNVDPAGWRYPEGDHLVAAIDNIIEGNEGAWKVPIDTGGPPLRAPFELKSQSRESVEARFYRYLRDEAGGNEDNDGPMICAGLGDQFDFLRGEECDEAIRRAIDARAAIAEGKK